MPEKAFSVCIKSSVFIDPPYNTGHDFVYKDDFAADADAYKKASGEYDENGGRLVANPETSGRFHSDWCSMIYPRLLLARDFLTPDGAIFISIDDNEQANLEKICDEVFGASNFIAQLVWQRAYSPKNDARFVSNSNDYVLMYSRDISKFTIGCLPRTEEANSRYQNPDNDPRSPWMSSDISEKTYDPNNDYPTQRPRGESWSLQDGRIWFGPDGDNTPRIKRFLSELKFDGMAPQSILPYSEVGHSQEGSQETSKLMGGGYFDGPKPVRLLQRILRLGNAKDDSLIRDFFSGSATTAHAVMKTNAEDGGNRRFSSPTYTITRGTQQDTMSKSDVDAGSAMHIIAKSARKSLDVTPPPRHQRHLRLARRDRRGVCRDTAMRSRDPIRHLARQVRNVPHEPRTVHRQGGRYRATAKGLAVGRKHRLPYHRRHL